MTKDVRGQGDAARWRRREFLLALGALAGCGGGGGGGDNGVLPAGTKLWDMQFADAQTGYAVGKQGLIARSDDGGGTWHRMDAQSTANLTSILTTSRELVVACSDDEAVLRTVDGGAHWQTIRQGYGSPVDTAHVAFAPDAGHVGLRIDGNVRGGGVDRLEITTNGGLDWLTTLPPGGSPIPWAPRYTPSGFLFGLIYGPPYVFWVSDDFGATFRQAPLTGESCGPSGDHGIWLQTSSGGAGKPPASFALSQDCFQTWTEVPMQVQGVAADAQPSIDLMTLDAAGRGWALSAEGATATGMLHTSDGGRTWIPVAVPASPSGIPAIIDGMGCVTYGNSTYETNAVAQSFTTDAGATWRHFDGAPPDAAEAFITRDGGGGLLARVGSLQTGYSWQRSMDDGRSWRTLL